MTGRRRLPRQPDTVDLPDVVARFSVSSRQEILISLIPTAHGPVVYLQRIYHRKTDGTVESTVYALPFNARFIPPMQAALVEIQRRLAAAVPVAEDA